MSEQEKNVLDRLAEIVPQLGEEGQKRLAYMCEGMVLALDNGADGTPPQDEPDKQEEAEDA